MTTAIIYYSKHHGNTKKLLDAISSVSRYDRIGFASGIYYGKFAEQVLNFAKVNLPLDKDVFYIASAGNPTKNCFNSIAEIAKEKHSNELGRYICHGFDTFGPFKLVGGIQKGHPTEEEIQGAVEFYKYL